MGEVEFDPSELSEGTESDEDLAEDGFDDFDEGGFDPATIAEEPLGPEDESTINIFERLLSTEPSIPLEEVEDPWNPEIGGTRRVYRGIMKLGDFEGLPAIADIVIGLAEVMAEQSENGNDSGGFDDF